MFDALFRRHRKRKCKNSLHPDLFPAAAVFSPFPRLSGSGEKFQTSASRFRHFCRIYFVLIAVGDFCFHITLQTQTNMCENGKNNSLVNSVASVLDLVRKGGWGGYVSEPEKLKSGEKRERKKRKAWNWVEEE